MNETDILVNKVANSGLVTIDLEQYYPKQDLIEFDIKPFLFRELILKELDFRKAIQEVDWKSFEGKILCVFCSVDAIIPKWAYMLIAKYAQEHVADLQFGNKDQALLSLFEKTLRSVNWAIYKDQKIVIKGCGDLEVPASAYQTVCYLLTPFASSIMYGEPCSTVPIFKKKKAGIS
ncbi:MAG: DUF2480 family protein [Saprospiraceae bacterium]|nr:DUF2480 family protein [Saprospiraceae bacterium]